EDGIRDFHVTEVQTCALPISGRAPDLPLPAAPGTPRPHPDRGGHRPAGPADASRDRPRRPCGRLTGPHLPSGPGPAHAPGRRHATPDLRHTAPRPRRTAHHPPPPPPAHPAPRPPA